MKDKLQRCMYCGTMMVKLEIQDNTTDEVVETLACPKCFEEDPDMFGDVAFGRAVIAE